MRNSTVTNIGRWIPWKRDCNSLSIGFDRISKRSLCERKRVLTKVSRCIHGNGWRLTQLYILSISLDYWRLQDKFIEAQGEAEDVGLAPENQEQSDAVKLAIKRDEVDSVVDEADDAADTDTETKPRIEQNAQGSGSRSQPEEAELSDDEDDDEDSEMDEVDA